MPIKPSPAVLRAVDVLEFLATRPADAPTMSEIARRTGLNKATCQSVLLALAERGYVLRDASSLGYSLGPVLIPLGTLASSSLRLPQIAQPEMETLSNTLGVTTVAAVTAGAHMMVVSAVGAPQPFHVSPEVGQLVPFVPPLGAAFVAWAPRTEVDAWLNRALRRLNQAERQHFLEALEVVRANGYSVTLDHAVRGEFGRTVEQLAIHPDSQEAQSRRDALIAELGVTNYLPVKLEHGRTYRLTQVSAPVFDHAGTVALVLLIVALGLELETEQIAACGQRVREAAARITELVAGVPPYPHGEWTDHQTAAMTGGDRA